MGGAGFSLQRTSVRFQIAVAVASGLAAAIASVYAWQTSDPGRLLGYLLLTVAVSAAKTKIPGLDCAVSLGFVAVLVGVAVMSLPETILGAAISGIVQTLWPGRRPRAFQVAFNTGLLAASTWMAHVVAHAAAPQSPVLRVLAGVAPLYLFNAGAVAGLINLSDTWEKFQFAVLPRYIMGAVFAALLADRSLVSSGWMPLLPAAALVHWLFSEDAESRLPCGA